MDKTRELLMRSDWKLRGYMARILGVIIIIFGIGVSGYFYLSSEISSKDFIAAVILAVFFGILFFLVSWIYLPFKK